MSLWEWGRKQTASWVLLKNGASRRMGEASCKVPVPGVRPVLGRHSLAAAREAKSTVSFSSPAFWLRWEENIATSETSERLMPCNMIYGAPARRFR